MQTNSFFWYLIIDLIKNGARFDFIGQWWSRGKQP